MPVYTNDHGPVIDEFKRRMFHLYEKMDLDDDFVKNIKELISLARKGNRLVMESIKLHRYESFKNDESYGTRPRILFPTHVDGGYKMNVLWNFYLLCKEEGVDLYISGEYGPQKLF